MTHTAHFAPEDPTARILQELACPACGYVEAPDVYQVSPGNRVRFFCDGCGAFVTILLSQNQADAVRRWSSGRPNQG